MRFLAFSNEADLRVAVLADIHANLEAFQAVLRDIEQQRADRILHLGDLGATIHV